MSSLYRACAAVALSVPVAFLSAQPAANKPPPAKRPDVAPWARQQVDAILKRAADPDLFDAAAGDAQTLFDQMAAYAPDGSPALADADFALRLLTQLRPVPAESRTPLVGYLEKHQDLARTLAFLVKPRDQAKNVYAVLDTLRTKAPAELGQFPALGAAICVVHDTPVIARASIRKGEKPRTIDPAEVLRYYAARDSRLVFSTRTLPAELLVYLVDSTAEPDELEWAFAKHAGDRNVGNRYNDIVYDTAFYKMDKPKKISALPYTLANIRQVGGVCEEQAYYASNVGKAIGVPSVFIYGRDISVAHAWDGLLVSRGSGYAWDLDEGCFGDYKKLRGSVTDPQTGQDISSQELTLLAQSVAVPLAEREQAVACADAARRLASVASREQNGWPPAPPEPLGGAAARPATVASAMALLERAVKLSPTSTSVWTGLAPMAKDMTAADRVRWSEALLRACEASPDFVHRVMGLMINALEDPKAQAQAWAWAASRYPRRADLRALALISQAQALEKAGDDASAYDCYQEVADKLINDAPESVDALIRAERFLKAKSKAAAAIDLYAGAFRRVGRPSNVTPSVFRQSNFYRVGSRYATLLEEAGRGGEAARVRSQLRQGEERDKG